MPLFNDPIVNYRGRMLIQKRGSVGGFRSVFVKLQGTKNELVYPTFGGMVMNPFKQPAKMFAGDLCWFKTDSKGVNPEIYLLKTFECVSAATTTINIKRDAYRHRPCVGDILMVAPEIIGGSGTAVTVSAVTETTVEVSSTEYNVWAVTVSDNIASSISNGTILVEAVEAGSNKKMLVETVNAIIDCDCDFVEGAVVASGKNTVPELANQDFDSPRYIYTPALGGLMYIHKMSPMPKCVLDLNRSNVNGWFKIDYYDMRAIQDSTTVMTEINAVQSDVDGLKPLSGATDPTSSTAASYVGQIYTNTTDNGMFMCISITGTTSKTYTWKEITFAE